MDEVTTFRVQIEALKAMAYWKSSFAEEVATQARELARHSDPPGLITVGHYRQAAKFALRALETLVQEAESTDGRQEAT